MSAQKRISNVRFIRLYIHIGYTKLLQNYHFFLTQPNKNAEKSIIRLIFFDLTQIGY